MVTNSIHGCIVMTITRGVLWCSCRKLWLLL
uniref:Uncharacterized protein n=1 Tax=Arundo donax TaxID=35708 RepID=A0A0A9BIC2_ARUDO